MKPWCRRRRSGLLIAFVDVASLLAGLCVALPVAAAEWVLVAEDGTVQVFTDKSGLAREGRYLRAWFRWDYSSPQTTMEGKYFLSFKALKHFDCALRQSSVRQVVLYTEGKGQGVVVDSAIFPPDDVNAHMQAVVAQTVAEAELDYVCKNAPGAKPAPQEPKAAPQK
jgi:hypothetical protein